MGKLSHLTRLSPFGPIFGKELRTTARRKRTYFLRFFYLLALLLALLGVWSGTAYQREHTQSVAERAQNDARLGAEFFTAFSMFSVFALGLISPILTATAVSAERQEKTLPVLLMTPITSWQIISGKLLSRLLAAVTLIGLSLPVLAVVRLLGSLELEQMGGMLGLCAITSLTGAAIGLFYSTFLNRAYAVILLSYATMLLMYAFVPFVLALTIARSGPRTSFLQFLFAINPFANMLALIEGQRFMGRISTIPCICVHLCLTALLVFWSSAKIRKLARREGEAAGKAAPDESGAASLALASMQEGMPIDPPFDSAASIPPPLEYARPHVASARAKVERTVSDNPILWREIRRPLMARRRYAIIGGVVVIGLLLLTYILIANSSGYHNNLADSEAQTGFACVFHGLLILVVCVLSATTIAGEKESDTWTLLLAAPVSGRAIVMGKIAGIFRRLLWPWALVTFHFVIFTLFGVISIWALALILWVLFTFNMLWIATGLYFSLRVRKTTFAVILNLLMPVLLYIVVTVLLLIGGNVLTEGRRGRWEESVYWYLPFYYLERGMRHLNGNDDYGFQTVYMANDVTTTIGGFIQYAFIAGVGYLSVAALVVWHAIRQFDAIVGRARQRV